MKTRKHIHEEEFNVGPDEMFRILHTPTAICKWWGASRAIVLAERTGFGRQLGGENGDERTYTTAFVIKAFEPPKRIVLGGAKYCTRESKLPFDARMTSEFLIEPIEAGCLLRVTQDGFP